MGLFSKNELTCKKCGKTYLAGMFDDKDFCEKCKDEARRLEREEREAKEKHRSELTRKLADYVVFNSITTGKFYEVEELEAIEKRHDEKKQRLACDGDIVTFPIGFANTSVFTDRSFVTANGAIIDAADIFAITVKTEPKLSEYSNLFHKCEAFSVAVFTNDSDIPVFPFVFAGKLKMFQVSAKDFRDEVLESIQNICPNLQYPVMDPYKLWSKIEKEKSVNGNIDYDFMLEMLSNANRGKGLFNPEFLGECNFGENGIITLHDMGYVDIVEMLQKMK